MGCLGEPHGGMTVFTTVPLNAQTGRVSCVCVSTEKLIKLSEYIEHVDWNIGSQVDVLEGS